MNRIIGLLIQVAESVFCNCIVAASKEPKNSLIQPVEKINSEKPIALKLHVLTSNPNL